MAYGCNCRDGEEDSFLCKPCNRIFGSHQALQDHLSKSPRHNYCVACERDFKDNISLRNHLASKHHQDTDSSSWDIDGGKDSFLCKPCDRTFGSHQALQDHLSKSPRHNYCIVCERDFKDDISLRNHLASKCHHDADYPSCDSDGEEDSFLCKPCDRTFGSHQALQDHLMKSSHHNYCIACERDFKDDISLRNHLASKRHQAPRPACRSGFVSPAALAKHMEKIKCCHLNNKKIVDKVKDSKQSNNNPINITINVTSGATKESSSGNGYACPISSQGFCKMSNLMVDVHKLDKFRCHKCKSNYDPINVKTKATKRHVNGHSYGCTICGQDFHKLSSLSQHLDSNVHKPSEFKCQKCKR